MRRYVQQTGDRVFGGWVGRALGFVEARAARLGDPAATALQLYCPGLTFKPPRCFAHNDPDHIQGLQAEARPHPTL